MKAVLHSVLKALNFCCMVVVLGLQELLEGSWSAEDVKPVNAENGLK